MKKMKKLFFSVFALSALMLSACSGNGDTPSSSAAGESSSTQQSSSAQSSSAAQSSSEEESSSGGGGSSSEAPVVQADYRVTIGTQTYDLVPNEDQVGHDKEYFLGANVSKTVAVGEKVSFEKLQNDAYSAFAVNPSPDAEDYNNVELVGSDYKIKVAGSVGVYLKLDGSDWSYWITGGGKAPDKWYESYRLAYGETNEAATWGFEQALEGSATEGGEGYLKQLKFTIEVPAGKTYGAKVRNAIDSGDDSEWYGENYAQEAYRDADEKDNNITLTEGKYDIYFKLLEENGHGIWVAKYGPKTFEHLYFSVNGEVPETNFVNRIENLKNQFYIENLSLNNGDVLSVWFDKGMTQNAFNNFNEANDEFFGLFTVQTAAKTITTVRKGIYSFYFDEAYDSDRDLHVLDMNVLKIAEKQNLSSTIKIILPDALEAGKNIYILGLDGKWDNAGEGNVLTPNAGRTEWSKTFSLSDAANLFKPIIWDGTGTKDNYDWNTLNQGMHRYVNWCIVGGEDYDIDLVPEVYNVTFRVKLPSSGLNIHVAGDFNSWNKADANYALTETDPTHHIYTGTFEIEEGDHEFKFVNGEDFEFNGVPDSNRGISVYASGSTKIYTFDSHEEYVIHNVTANIVGGDPVPLTDIKDPSDESNYEVYDVALTLNQEIEFRDGTELIHFFDNEGAVKYKATAAGTYRFFFSKSGLMYVSAPVTFNVTSTTVESGLSVYIVGDFNDWTPSAASKLTFTAGTYSITLTLPGGEQEYKYIKVADTDTSFSNKYWENLEDSEHHPINRSVEVNQDVQNLDPVVAAFDAYVAPIEYAATINSANVENLESYAIAHGDDNVWAYQFDELAAGDVIGFTADSSAINFCHWEAGDPGHAESDGNTYTIQVGEGGSYRFFYKDGEGIYVQKVVPSGYYLCGSLNSWSDQFGLVALSGSDTTYTVTKSLTKDTLFKIYTPDGTTHYYSSVDWVSNDGSAELVDDGFSGKNVKILADGNYTITFWTNAAKNYVGVAAAA